MKSTSKVEFFRPYLTFLWLHYGVVLVLEALISSPLPYEGTTPQLKSLEIPDSEIDCRLPKPYHRSTNKTISADEGDAESCICDNSSGILECDDQESNQFGDEHHSEDEESKIKSKSCNAIGMELKFADHGERDLDISRKMKDDLEDGRFWEICLAFGYP